LGQLKYAWLPLILALRGKSCKLFFRQPGASPINDHGRAAGHGVDDALIATLSNDAVLAEIDRLGIPRLLSPATV
jgi:hypothetical protein